MSTSETQPSPPAYVLITPAHDEAAFIEFTLASVAAQTCLPLKWVLVDDASNDGTAEILRRWQQRYPAWIEVVRLERGAGRNFGHKVRAFNAGLARMHGLGYEFIGNLDADISLEPDYYERVLESFGADAQMGVAGGMVASQIDGRFVRQQVSLDSVAGAVQLFRRHAFEAIGGYRALPRGGIDSAAEIMLRSRGWRVRTLAAVEVREHRRTGTANANPLTARVREGWRMYSLGYGLAFFLARCVRRATERPRLLGSMAALWGFCQAYVHREPRVLAAEEIEFLRREQRGKLWQLVGRARHTPGIDMKAASAARQGDL